MRPSISISSRQTGCGSIDFIRADPTARRRVACLMTGMYTPRHQLYQPGGKSKGDFKRMRWKVPTRGRGEDFQTFVSNANWIDGKWISVAEVLNSAGYATARIGKWHLGEDVQGFDLSTNDGVHDYGPDHMQSRYADVDVAEQLTDRAVQFIEQHQHEPFFSLCFSLGGSHPVGRAEESGDQVQTEAERHRQRWPQIESDIRRGNRSRRSGSGAIASETGGAWPRAEYAVSVLVRQRRTAFVDEQPGPCVAAKVACSKAAFARPSSQPGRRESSPAQRPTCLPPGSISFPRLPTWPALTCRRANQSMESLFCRCSRGSNLTSDRSSGTIRFISPAAAADGCYRSSAEKTCSGEPSPRPRSSRATGS